jgi:endonuclease/exonuclease/phosphatase family metal-dependent hydrolase
MHRFLALFLISLVSAVSAVEIRVASFNVGAHFGETYFDYGIGDVTTQDHLTVRAILSRIDADVVALQEIHTADLEGSPDDLDDLAAFLGYPYQHVASISGAFDNTFQTVILSRYPFITAGDINSPPGANEITRLHPVVKVDVPGTTNDPVIISTHLKSETGLAERFRRAVEMRRVVGHIENAGLTNSENFIVLGDFNPSSTDTVFAAPPSGLPGSYVLGNDITFPVNYWTDPVDYFTSPGAARVEARQLDGSASTYDTVDPEGPTLDLILVSPAMAARPTTSEVYNSTLDLSNESGLPKTGAPLAETTSSVASDHYAVFADVNLDDAGPYAFTAPGQTVMEDFTGFQGNNDPAPWVSGGGIPWLGVDDGSSGVEGFRSYGTATDGSLGFISEGQGAYATASIVNQTSTLLTALQIAMDAEQWRSAMNGTADEIHAELVTNAGTVPLAGLSFSASKLLPSGPVAGGATTPLQTVVTGLAIPPGDSFQLKLSFVPGAGGGVASSDVFVNEFHYDNNGADSGEFVEIAVAPGYSGALSDISLVRYNGSSGAANSPDVLTSFTAGATTPSGHRLFYKVIDGIQNDVEGFAVVVASTVLHFISYEGSFTATNGPAIGMTSTDIGVAQNGEVVGEAALGLTGTGASAADFTWTKFSGIPYSPGQLNAGQTFAASYLPSQGLAIDNLRVTFLTDSDFDGQSDAYEIAFGSNPLDSGSRFVPVINSAPELSFPGAVGISYTVEYSIGLSGWQDLSSHAGNGQMIVIPLPTAEPNMFFRVRAGN